MQYVLTTSCPLSNKYFISLIHPSSHLSISFIYLSVHSLITHPSISPSSYHSSIYRSILLSLIHLSVHPLITHPSISLSSYHSPLEPLDVFEQLLRLLDEIHEVGIVSEVLLTHHVAHECIPSDEAMDRQTIRQLG